MPMHLSSLKEKLNPKLYSALEKSGINELTPSQQKAIKAGLLERKSLLVCTPTSSGKTLIAEIAALQAILNRGGKAIYIVPLKALANEKFRDFRQKYGDIAKIAITIGDVDSDDSYLIDYDLIICTAEKLDSLIRHSTPWLKYVSVVCVDEIHLINDESRGPTLEILIILLKELLKNVQLICLSATIGNPKELSDWLGTELVLDDWRPVKLHKGILLGNKVMFEKE